MKITYVGPKGKISVHIPVGAKSKGAITGNYDFLRNQPQEINDEDGRKILALDKHAHWIEGEPELVKAPETEVVDLRPEALAEEAPAPKGKGGKKHHAE